LDPQHFPSGTEWVTLKEGSKVTGKTVKTVRRWAQEGKVGAQKDDKGQWFLRRGDLNEVEPVAEAKAEIQAMTETLTSMQAGFHALAQDLAAASERAGRAEGERNALADEVERLRAEAEQRADFEEDRRQCAEAETDAAKVERDRIAYEVEELRVTLKAELDRRWWQRRGLGT